jgi:hypothetical protein
MSSAEHVTAAATDAAGDAAALAVRLAQVLAEAARLAGPHSEAAEPAQLRRLWAAAALRNRLAPALAGESAADSPLHLAVIGGTNSGKSTIVNCLLAKDLAPVAPTVRFSQHPEAFAPPDADTGWVDRHPERLAGFECFRDAHPPRQDDAQLAAGYRRAWALWKTPRDSLPGVVVWDTPDISTRAAEVYRAATLEVLALADAVVLAVTEERYADRLGIIYFQIILEGSGRVIAVVNKAPPRPDALLQAVTETLSAARESVGCRDEAAWDGRAWALPRLPTAAPSADDWREVGEAKALREQLSALLSDAHAVRRSALRGAAHLIDEHLESALEPLEARVRLAEQWSGHLHEQILPQVLAAYRSDYLDATRYAEFDQAMLRLMRLLRVRGIGEALDRLDGAVRSAGRWALRSIRRAIWGPTSEMASPQPVEKTIVSDCLERLRRAASRECQRRREQSDEPTWSELSKELAASDGLSAGFWPAYEQYRQQMDQRQQEVANAIHEMLAARPGALNLLKGLKLTAQVAAGAGAAWIGGWAWSSVVIVPAVVYLTEKLVELIGRGALELQARRLKTQQLEAFEQLMRDHAVEPLAALAAKSIDASAVRHAPAWWRQVRRAVLNLEAAK